MVEDVEGIGAQGEGEPFENLRLLLSGEIEVRKAGAGERVALHRCPGRCRQSVRWLRSRWLVFPRSARLQAEV